MRFTVHILIYSVHGVEILESTLTHVVHSFIVSGKKTEGEHKLIKATLPVPLRPRGILSSLSKSNFRHVQSDSEAEMVTDPTTCFGTIPDH